MRETKKQMRDILRQDIQVSDVVNQRQIGRAHV